VRLSWYFHVFTKVLEDDVQISDGSNSLSFDGDQEEEVLSKAECEVFFREEVRAWLDENGPNLFGTGMPIPKLVRTDVASSNRSSTVNTPYSLLIKSKRLLYRWLTDLASKNPKRLLRLTLLVPKLFE